VEGSCQHGNELPGSVKCWEILEWLHNWRLLRKGISVEFVSRGDGFHNRRRNLNSNSVVLIRKRTIPTERPQPVDEVSANFS
jgi:hypothetical protein